jgi:proteasome lid subunit RPN8/RPN11
VIGVIREISVRREVLEQFLELCREIYPNENIMLIRGKVKHGAAEIEEFLIPPFSTYGGGFSGFSPFMIPFDLSIIGVAHSHPSGNVTPSNDDVNHFFGRIMIIAGYPYNDSILKAYDGKGITIPVRVLG